MSLLDAHGADSAERAALLALNNAHATELSTLTPARFDSLLENAWLALAATDASALLLAFHQSATYDSPNFLWFRTRLTRFAYIDRIVVVAGARRRGIAREMYAAVLERASAEGLDWLCCEVNLDPPNPSSSAFHAALGFAEMGRAILANGRAVRYLARSIR